MEMTMKRTVNNSIHRSEMPGDRLHWTNDKNSYGAVLDYKKTSCYAEIAEHNEDGTMDAYYVGAEGQIASSMMARVGINNQELFDENQ